MILTEFVTIKTHTRLKQYYIDKGYDMSDDFVNINVFDLTKSSHILIDVKCDVCEAEKQLPYNKYIKNISSGYYACSSKCSVEKCKNTFIEKYGVDHPSKNIDVQIKTKKTNIERYGFEHQFKNDEIKNKIKQTNLIKYGETTILKLDYIRKKGIDYIRNNQEQINNKRKITNIKKYGVDHPSKNEDIKYKTKQTNLEHHGTLNGVNKEKYEESIIENFKIKYSDINFIDINHYNKMVTLYCDECKNNYTISFGLFRDRYLKKYNLMCIQCNPLYSNSTSNDEKELLNFIKENYKGEIITNSRKIISPLELDIFLPELKIAFEFNGVYWHNELNKANNYHYDKTNICNQNDIQLIHIWEDDWNHRQEIVKSMILNKLKLNSTKIFARKCELKEILDNKLSTKFLTENHIQGNVSSSIKLGLFYDNELVSIMTFGKKRKIMNSISMDGEFELLRFCNKLNTTVIGGASKLFNHFIKNYNYTEINTYADRSYSNGELYNQLGFQFEHITKPNYYYVIDGIRKHRFGFRKDVLVKQGFDINKTEHEIMLERKIYRIYNSGNYKFIFKKV